jgi:hypothetical protein
MFWSGEFFFFINDCFQDLDNNGDFWNRMEIYCRDLTKTYSDVRSNSDPEEGGSGQRTMQNGRKKKPHKMMKYPVRFENYDCNKVSRLKP